MRVKRLSPLANLPRYATAAAAGLDLTAAIPGPLTIDPGQRAMIETGLAIELPPEHEGQVRPRSGLAARHGVTVINAPGTIDEDYRGEVRVLLVNLGAEPFVVQPGTRIAQLIVAPVTRVDVREEDTLSATERGAGGFGHTGSR